LIRARLQALSGRCKLRAKVGVKSVSQKSGGHLSSSLLSPARPYAATKGNACERRAPRGRSPQRRPRVLLVVTFSAGSAPTLTFFSPLGRRRLPSVALLHVGPDQQRDLFHGLALPFVFVCGRRERHSHLQAARRRQSVEPVEGQREAVRRRRPHLQGHRQEVRSASLNRYGGAIGHFKSSFLVLLVSGWVKGRGQRRYSDDEDQCEESKEEEDVCDRADDHFLRWLSQKRGQELTAADVASAAEESLVANGGREEAERRCKWFPAWMDRCET